MSGPPTVDIHYLRPPDRRDVFRQLLLVDEEDVKVTLATDLAFDPPLTISGRIVLETGSAAVWFTFPGRWHDIGLFHREYGAFTGTYANILTPPAIHDDGTWYTTDLFLDVWLAPDGSLSVRDRDQFDRAVAEGLLDAEQATGALSELDRILAEHAAGSWPPPVVEEWSLQRAMRAARAERG